jgi:hypothetical protein
MASAAIFARLGRRLGADGLRLEPPEPEDPWRAGRVRPGDGRAVPVACGWGPVPAWPGMKSA